MYCIHPNRRHLGKLHVSSTFHIFQTVSWRVKWQRGNAFLLPANRIWQHTNWGFLSLLEKDGTAFQKSTVPPPSGSGSPQIQLVPEDEGTVLLWHIAECSPNSKVSHTRYNKSSNTTVQMSYQHKNCQCSTSHTRRSKTCNNEFNFCIIRQKVKQPKNLHAWFDVWMSADTQTVKAAGSSNSPVHIHQTAGRQIPDQWHICTRLNVTAHKTILKMFILIHLFHKTWLCAAVKLVTGYLKISSHKRSIYIFSITVITFSSSSTFWLVFEHLIWSKVPDAQFYSQYSLFQEHICYPAGWKSMNNAKFEILAAVLLMIKVFQDVTSYQ